ncbi:hypothetical protein OSB04_011348 [Centaurea solstitialis]|uniref:hAT-like transposase RNase-H fold domain-containing protein n=1 Tax=Centaurea solstitialis TaxID=347529 RepID=A0AA38TAZ8_9ASTR|nr:hypothetical protein OSB04_011348 [Centaurea solstitialis]
MSIFQNSIKVDVARDCLSIYKDEINTLKGLLKGQTVSLTTDTWTSVQNYNYMCLTAHWVDDNWVLRKKILNFCQCSNHRGETIGKLVYECLQKWGIEKVFTVTVDNASSHDGAIRFLKTMLKGPNAILDCKYLHLRCCAHIINLVVKDGLDEHFDSISRIRNAVRYVRSSPSRYATFLESVEKVKSDCKRKPCLDCETRWNSTFLMLETAEKYVDAFERLSLIDKKYKAFFRETNEANDEDDLNSTRKRKRNERALGAPEEEDWEKARGFIEYLKIFFNVTKKVSGSHYVTSNLFFDNVNFLLHVALVLDPRNKLCYLEYCLGLIYGKDSTKCSEVLDRVRKSLDELYNHYKMKINTSNVTHTDASSSSSAFFESSLKVDFEDDYAKFMEERGQGANKTEVEIYLSDANEKRTKNETFDVLGWWKSNSVTL